MFITFYRRKPHNDNENNEEGSSSSAGTTAIDNTTTSNVEDASTLTKVSKPAMSSGSHQVSFKNVMMSFIRNYVTDIKMAAVVWGHSYG